MSVRQVQASHIQNLDATSATRFMCVAAFLFIACCNEYMYVDPSAVSTEIAICDKLFHTAAGHMGIVPDATGRRKLRAAFEKHDVDGSTHLELPELVSWVTESIGTPLSGEETAALEHFLRKLPWPRLNWRQFEQLILMNLPDTTVRKAEAHAWSKIARYLEYAKARQRLDRNKDNHVDQSEVPKALGLFEC